MNLKFFVKMSEENWQREEPLPKIVAYRVTMLGLHFEVLSKVEGSMCRKATAQALSRRSSHYASCRHRKLLPNSFSTCFAIPFSSSRYFAQHAVDDCLHIRADDGHLHC